MKAAVIGAGMFGYPMANYLAELGMEVKIFDADRETIKYIKEKKKHPHHFPFLKSHENLEPYLFLHKAVEKAGLIVSAVPSQHVREAMKELYGCLPHDPIILNLAKGIELGTNQRLSQVITQELKGEGNVYYVATLSGGMIAEEFAKKEPLFADVASDKPEISKKLEQILTSKTLFIKASDDLTGVELAGPLKNVLAVSYGIGERLGYGPSTMAGFLASSSRQIKELALHLGAKEKTFSSSSYAWEGDLHATCNGKSRNRQFGQMIGEGYDPQQAMAEMTAQHRYVEGYATTKAFYELIRNEGLSHDRFPIIKETYLILYEGKKPAKAIEDLVKAAINRRQQGS